SFGSRSAGSSRSRFTKTIHPTGQGTSREAQVLPSSDRHTLATSPRLAASLRARNTEWKNSLTVAVRFAARGELAKAGAANAARMAATVSETRAGRSVNPVDSRVPRLPASYCPRGPATLGHGRGIVRSNFAAIAELLAAKTCWRRRGS